MWMDVDEGSHDHMGQLYRPPLELWMPDEVSEAPSFPCLDIIGGPLASPSASFRLCAAEATNVGSGYARVSLPGRGVAARHAVFHVRGGVVFVEALAPLRVDDVEVHGKALVDDDAVVTIGEHSLALRRRRFGARFSPEVYSVSVAYRWDMYHERPNRYRDPALESFSVTFDDPDTIAELERRFAAAPEVVDDCSEVDRQGRRSGNGRRYRAAAPYYLWSGAVHASISWWSEEPTFARPRVDDDQRTAWIAAVFADLDGISSPQALLDRCRDAPAGVELTGILNGDDVWLEFKPELPVDPFLHALGWTATAFAFSGDVHMSSWRIRTNESVYCPVIGAWEVDVSLDRWPQPRPGIKTDHKADRSYPLSTHSANIRSVCMRRPRR